MGRAISLGMIETRGFAGLTQATDAMHKAAAVETVRQFYIGGSFASILVKGDVAAATSAVAAGKNDLEKLCDVVATHTIATIDEDVVDMLLAKKTPPDELPRAAAVGVVETQGVVGALEASKRGLDAAVVDLAGYMSSGGGLIAVTFIGNVSDVRAAVKAAAEAAGEITKVYAVTIIPAPHPLLTKGFGRNFADIFEPDAKAIGTLETMGFVSLFEASDAALKAADVGIGNWQAIGSGYNSVSYSGDVAAVRSALEAAEASAREVDRFVDSMIIPSPHEVTVKLVGAGRKPKAGARNAGKKKSKS